MATCAECGSELQREAAFCGNCGAPARIAVPGTPPDPVLPPTDPSSQPPPKAPGPVAGAPRKRTALTPGALVDNKYAIQRVLGEGGMGVVYLARDIHTGLDIVVKAVRSEYAHRPDVRQRTLDEGRALARIDHPNVVRLNAVVVEDQSLLLVMQYIEGESLDRTILHYTERGERMPLDEALSLLRQIAAGVGAAHAEGVIHRDLKPANVLIRAKDHMAKVTDFGIAKSATDADSRAQTKGIIGSLWYMSPEQVTGRRDLDARSDIYSLGIVLYQMLAGHVPFDAESDYEIMRLHAEGAMPHITQVRPDVPQAVDDLIQKACAKQREQRYQSCDELIAAIDRAALGAAPMVTAPAGPMATAPAAPLYSGMGGSAMGGMQQGSYPPPPVGVAPTAPPTTRDEGSSNRGWIMGAVGLGLVGGVGALFAMGLLPGLGESNPSKPASSIEGTPPSTSTSPGAKPSAKLPPKSPLEVLEGAWVANGKELEAVLVGDTLEFRIKKPTQFTPQDYQVGEARFVLRTTATPDVFAAEDRIRPLPPAGKTYDPRSRSTCQELWSTASGRPLQARYDEEGKRLTVEFAKIEPTLQNFVFEGSKIVSCRGLRALEATRVESTLTRQ